MAAPAAGLVEMKELVCLGVVLTCLACVSTRLPWVLEKVTASVEKERLARYAYARACTTTRRNWLLCPMGEY